MYAAGLTGVLVARGVAVAVAVGIGAGVAVRTGVGVGVAVRVGLGDEEPPPPHAATEKHRATEKRRWVRQRSEHTIPTFMSHIPEPILRIAPFRGTAHSWGAVG